MKIIGCDFHPSFQQIAMIDTETGEHEEKRLTPSEAILFYRQMEDQPVMVGMEASGNTLWFERLLTELGHQMRMGDALLFSTFTARLKPGPGYDQLGANQRERTRIKSFCRRFTQMNTDQEP